MAVIEGNFLEFVLQETAKGFSRSGKSINLNQNQWLLPQRKRCSGGFTDWFQRKCHISIVRSCERVYVERFGLYFTSSYLSSSKLNGRTDNRGKINGFDSEFSSQSFAWRRGCGEISIVILVSLFVCCFRFSGVFRDIPSIKVYRLPKLQIFLAQGLQTRSETFRHVRWKCQSFFERNFQTSF